MDDKPAAPAGLTEVAVFVAPDAYVYRIPPATTVGHRAETWNVNSWIQEVRVRVVCKDEEAAIRLEDPVSGALFAECPIPTDVPLITVVEPVIDSSRYFVLKIVDRDSGRHAFVGLGFRQREAASEFCAVLHAHIHSVHKKHAAEEDHERQLGQLSDGEGSGLQAESAGHAADLGLRQGENLTLKVPSDLRKVSGGGRAGFASGGRGRLAKSFSLLMDGEGNVVAGMSPKTPAQAEMALSPPSSIASTESAVVWGLETEGSQHMMPEASGCLHMPDEWADYTS